MTWREFLIQLHTNIQDARQRMTAALRSGRNETITRTRFAYGLQMDRLEFFQTHDPTVPIRYDDFQNYRAFWTSYSDGWDTVSEEPQYGVGTAVHVFVVDES